MCLGLLSLTGVSVCSVTSIYASQCHRAKPLFTRGPGQPVLVQMHEYRIMLAFISTSALNVLVNQKVLMIKTLLYQIGCVAKRHACLPTA